MMEAYTVSFFGHRVIDRPIPLEGELERLILSLLRNYSYVEFLVGRDGDFDRLVSSVIHRCKRNFREDNSALVWVLPYETADYRNNREAYHQYYDEIEIVESGGHYKAAFQNRNRSMILRSDLAVFFVERKGGGAYQTLQFAKAQGIACINLAEKPEG